MTKDNLHKGDKVYYARIIPTVGIYDVCDLTVRSIEPHWFVGIDKHDKHAYLFGNNAIGEIVYCNRDDALKKVKEAENAKPKQITQENEEIYYEEY